MGLSSHRVVPGRWVCRHIGWCIRWWRQQFRARPAEERATDPSLRLCFCRHPRRWVCRHRGDAHNGGDSSSVQNQLKDVQQTQAFASAFAAILADGSVVTWGDAYAICWWRLQFRARPVEERSAEPSLSSCFCRYPGRWGCCHMGQSRLWWWQQFRARSAEERVTESHICEHVACA